MTNTHVAIIDYGSGNLRSAQKAFEYVTHVSGMSASVALVTTPEELREATHIVLPGVGAFADCGRGLAAAQGMIDALNAEVMAAGKPFLGICVGMQLMAKEGHEYEIYKGLGWLDGIVTKITPQDKALKIPHMGWNTLHQQKAHPVLNGIEMGASGFHAYFVHSYHMQLETSDHVLATSHYAGDVTAMVGRDNMIGTQFHPEKSQALGLKLIENFIQWRP